MNIRAMLTLNAFLAFLHGIGFILAPSLLLGLYQIPQGAGASVMGQLFGAELLVVAIVCWKGRDFTSAAALSALVLGGVVGNTVGALVTLRATLGDVMGIMGWAGVLIYVVLAVGYLAVQRQKAPLASAA